MFIKVVIRNGNEKQFLIFESAEIQIENRFLFIKEDKTEKVLAIFKE